MIPWDEYIKTFLPFEEVNAKIEGILDELGIERSFGNVLTDYELRSPDLPLKFSLDESTWHHEDLFTCGVMDSPRHCHEVREQFRERIKDLRFFVFFGDYVRYYHLIWEEDLARPDQETRRQIEEVMGFKSTGYGECHRTYSLDGCYFTFYYVPDRPPTWTTTGVDALESIDAMRVWVAKQRGLMEKWEYLRRTLGWP